MGLGEIYTREWFSHDFEHLQPEFDVVADSIYRQFNPTHVVDVGCGPGMVVSRLRDLGVDARGVEGSEHGIAAAKETVRPFLTLGDITDMRWLSRQPGHRQIVICTEVAEHLDEKWAAHLVGLLCSAMCPVVFTAAPPGQDGHHHVNCQPPGYWQELFASRGAFYDSPATLELRCRWRNLERLSHMPRNVMVFR